MSERLMYRIDVYPRTGDESEALVSVTDAGGDLLAQAKSSVSTDVAVLQALGAARRGIHGSLLRMCDQIDPDCLVADYREASNG